ncbi:MAG: DUF1801 domain-containing protein [Deltaproteobacteria bacterium]
MVSSTASTVAEYIASLPAERGRAIAELRRLIVERLPQGFEECMAFGMIGYVVPFSRYPKTYNGQPLMLAALASQKAYLSLYLMSMYGDLETERWFADGFRRAGKRLDMGKSCVRFKSLEDLPLELIGDAIGRVGVEQFISICEAAHGGAAKGVAARASRLAPRASTRKNRGR